MRLLVALASDILCIIATTLVSVLRMRDQWDCTRRQLCLKWVVGLLWEPCRRVHAQALPPITLVSPHGCITLRRADRMVGLASR